MTATPSSPRAQARALLSISTVALLCTGLAGCSSSGTTPATPIGKTHTISTAATKQTRSATVTGGNADTKDPCALLTRAEAASAVGQPLTSGYETAALGKCDYSTPDFAAGVDITVSSWDSITNAAHSNGHTPPAVSGVGDQAYFGVGLSVRKGDKGFLLLMNGPHIDSLPDRGLAKEKALAALILPRM